MKKTELLKRIWILAGQAEKSSEIMPFREDISQLHINLRELLMTDEKIIRIISSHNKIFKNLYSKKIKKNKII